MIEAGDVVTAYLPGVSETKRRPAIVISTQAYHRAWPDVILALITSQIERADTEFDVAVYDWEAANLQLPSAMRSFLFTKPLRDVVRSGRLSTPDWSDEQARITDVWILRERCAGALPTHYPLSHGHSRPRLSAGCCDASSTVGTLRQSQDM